MAQWYRQALGKILNKEVDYNSDNIRATLHTSTYTPNLDTHDYVDDLTNELSTSGGYTVGGAAVPSPTITPTAANSWATTRANSTAYALGAIVRPATPNGFLYRAAVAGTSGGSIPTYPTTIGLTVADGGVTWENIGSAIIVLGGASVVWSAATFTGARYMVISDRTPGTAATQPLIGLIDFGSNQAGGGGDFTVAPATAAEGYLLVAVP